MLFNILIPIWLTAIACLSWLTIKQRTEIVLLNTQLKANDAAWRAGVDDQMEIYENDLATSLERIAELEEQLDNRLARNDELLSWIRDQEAQIGSLSSLLAETENARDTYKNFSDRRRQIIDQALGKVNFLLERLRAVEHIADSHNENCLPQLGEIKRVPRDEDELTEFFKEIEKALEEPMPPGPNAGRIH